MIYIGYYGPPAQLITSTSSAFNQSFHYVYNVTNNFVILDANAELGLSFDHAFIGTYDYTAVGFRNLVFGHDSTYSHIATLPIYVSS